MTNQAFKLLLLSLTLSLLQLGCGRDAQTMQPIAEATQNPTPQETKREEDVVRERPIISGDGLPNLKIGDDKQVALDLFDEGTESAFGYLTFPAHGISVKFNAEGTITHVFYYFASPKYSVFDGETEAGINKGSGLDDVIREYGEPTDRSESVVSEYGAMPGANEVSLTYDAEGLTFTFWDGVLADVRSLGKSE